MTKQESPTRGDGQTSPTPVDPVIGKGQFEHPTQEALGRVAELRTPHASIGPDSERIRKLEAEVERLRQDHFIISVSGGSMLTCVCRCGELLSAVGTSNPDWLLSAHIKQARAS